ncbi:MAG: hypothetical protein DYG89_54650 [Caldilinea sp. CFX5]|nr:hypothetical protein [Caldilinea sp. CFX5]
MQATKRAAPALPITYIRPSPGWRALNLAELWAYRELLYFLTWRDIKVRYKQTLLGAAWAILQPLLTMVVFSLFFGRLAGIPSDGIPYPIFAYAALVPWSFFAAGLNNSANSLVGNANLLQKVYFPRLAIPLSTVLAGVIDFALAFVVLLGMMLFYGIVPTVNTLWLPLLVLLALITSLGVVCLEKNCSGVSVPSKTYGLLACARPLLALLEAESEIGQLVGETGCGLVLTDATGATIAQTIRRLLTSPAALEQMGLNAHHAFQQNYRLDTALARYDLFLRQHFGVPVMQAVPPLPQPTLKQVTPHG